MESNTSFMGVNGMTCTHVLWNHMTFCKYSALW